MEKNSNPEKQIILNVAISWNILICNNIFVPHINEYHIIKRLYCNNFVDIFRTGLKHKDSRLAHLQTPTHTQAPTKKQNQKYTNLCTPAHLLIKILLGHPK